MTLLLGVDPGGKTGYAVLDTETMVIESMSINSDSPSECLFFVGSTYDSQRGDILVCERFVPRFGGPFDCTPMYLIGALQGQYDSEINLVMPASHKGVVPREKVKGLMKAQGYKIGAGHSLDALSLCIYWAGFKLHDKNVLEFLADN